MKEMHAKMKNQLFDAILSLQSREECEALFSDLCTIKEIEAMAQRLETAMRLSDEQSYQTIYGEVGVSTATISRVSRCLNYGADGYSMVIGRLKEKKDGEGDA